MVNSSESDPELASFDGKLGVGLGTRLIQSNINFSRCGCDDYCIN